MKVDAPGLVATAQRLIVAVQALGGEAAVPHPPLAADPASVGAAGRLTAAGGELAAALGAHIAALVASVEHLTGVALAYVAADEQNAADIAALISTTNGGAAVTGSAPPAPPIPPDVRLPIPPPVDLLPQAISAGVHAGAPGAGEGFTLAWSRVADAARDTAASIRSTVGTLPEVLDGPASTPAASIHLLTFADGLDTYADRAHNLTDQAGRYADHQSQAREDIPTPQQLTDAQTRVQVIAGANASSGGKYAVQLAQAVTDKNQLDEQAVSGYTGYHGHADTATAGDDVGTEAAELPFRRAIPEPAAVRGAPGGADPASETGSEALSAEATGGVGSEMTSMLPQVMTGALGSAGGLTQAPQALAQAGMQGISAATRGLSGLGDTPCMSLPDGSGLSGFGGGAGELGALGGAAPTSPAGGVGSPELGVAPSTGAPPPPTIAPAGANGGPAGESGGGMRGMGGMPMAAMGGLGGAGGSGGKAEARRRKVAVPDLPHTEDVTGRVDTSRLSVASAGQRDPAPDGPADPGEPIVRRLVARPPEEPS